MHTFSNEIFAQKPTIDTIEKNVNEAQVNVEAGALSLRQALSYKILHTSAGGAFIGTCIGGPLGFMAGAKIGALCGVGSGIIGYFVAKKIQKVEE
jgi:syntaxin 17